MPEPTVCTRCGRTLRSARACARGYGWRCYARRNRVAQSLLRSPNSKLWEAGHALLDGAVVKHPHRGVWWVVSRDGSRRYLTHAKRCNCDAGTKPLRDLLCWHRCAVIALQD